MAAVARHILLSGRYIVDGGGLPEGIIAMWSGLLANIPAGWSLCDGTGVTPNLIARFIRGAPAATEPGTTGGADSHTHASMTAAGGHTHTLGNNSHSHVVNSAGGHYHSGSATKPDAGAISIFRSVDFSPGAHTHTTDSKDHTHTLDAVANHTHPISTDDGRPSYYEVAYIRAGAGALVAANLIIIWTGTLVTIPAGWSLCDGGGGRPDLRTRFIRGINTAITNPGTIGGATTHLHTETAVAAHTHNCQAGGTHSHSFSAYTWTHSHNDNMYTGSFERLHQTDSGAGNHTHAASDSIGSHNHNALGNDGGHTHVVNAASSLPAYYDVAYIINDGGAIIIPTNGILIWTGLLANIPAGYSQHAGLRGYFARGSAAGIDPGGIGGSDTHTHTDNNAGTHNQHTLTSVGAHQHAATDTIGAHTHTTNTNTLATGTAMWALYTTVPNAGDHSHTYNSENNHTDHDPQSDPGNHNHNNWSTDDGRPAYYEVAFIQKA